MADKLSDEQIAEWIDSAPDNESSAFTTARIIRHIAHKAYRAGQEAMRESVVGVEVPEPTDLKGRFQTELFWRGVYAHRDAASALPISEE